MLPRLSVTEGSALRLIVFRQNGHTIDAPFVAAAMVTLIGPPQPGHLVEIDRFASWDVIGSFMVQGYHPPNTCSLAPCG